MEFSSGFGSDFELYAASFTDFCSVVVDLAAITAFLGCSCFIQLQQLRFVGKTRGSRYDTRPPRAPGELDVVSVGSFQYYFYELLCLDAADDT